MKTGCEYIKLCINQLSMISMVWKETEKCKQWKLFKYSQIRNNSVHWFYWSSW